jgi:hypothetical protein
MSEAVTNAGTRSCRPGEFIREATLRQLKVPADPWRRTDAFSDLVKGQAALTSHDGTMNLTSWSFMAPNAMGNGAEAGIRQGILRSSE